MTEEELIQLVRRELNEPVTTPLEACEALCDNGTPDELSGDVEAPTGHFYRVDRWIVTTDSAGFRNLHSFHTEDEAKAEFERLEAEYARWDWGNDD